MSQYLSLSRPLHRGGWYQIMWQEWILLHLILHWFAVRRGQPTSIGKDWTVIDLTGNQIKLFYYAAVITAVMLTSQLTLKSDQTRIWILASMIKYSSIGILYWFSHDEPTWFHWEEDLCMVVMYSSSGSLRQCVCVQTKIIRSGIGRNYLQNATREIVVIRVMVMSCPVLLTTEADL